MLCRLNGLMCPLFSMEAQSVQVENLLSEISAATNGQDFFLFPFAQCLLPPQTPFFPNFQWRKILLYRILSMLKVTHINLFQSK